MDVQASVLLFLSFLTVAAIVAFFADRLRIPFSVALVLAGLGVSFLRLQVDVLNDVRLEPDVILLIFLPGLIFEAGYHIDITQLRNQLRPILILAFIGVFISMFLVGFLVHLSMDIPLIVALLFGVLISATDPVAVLSIFKQLGVDRRLSVIMEGESLFNDGVAIVGFTILASLATGAATFSLVGVTVNFLLTVAGGALLGLLTGFLISEMMKRTDEPLIDIVLTVILAYGTYYIAEEVLTREILGFELTVSPVIAVAVAALIVGNYGSSGRLSATSDNMIIGFWEVIAFLINSAIFLLIGLEFSLANFGTYVFTLFVTIGIVLLARGVIVFGLTPIINIRSRIIPWRWSPVIFWGGMRGAVSVALALSIPFAIEQRGLLISMTFGYVFFSVIIQGSTLRPLLGSLNMHKRGDVETEFETMVAHLAAGQASIDAIDQLYEEHLMSGSIAEELKQRLRERIEQYQTEMNRLISQKPTVADINVRLVESELANSQRQSLQLLRKRGVISEKVFEDFTSQIDEFIRHHRLGHAEMSGDLEELMDHLFPSYLELKKDHEE